MRGKIALSNDHKVVNTIRELIKGWDENKSLDNITYNETNRGSTLATYNLINKIIYSDPLIPKELKDELLKINEKINLKSGRFKKYYSEVKTK